MLSNKDWILLKEKLPNIQGNLSICGCPWISRISTDVFLLYDRFSTVLLYMTDYDGIERYVPYSEEFNSFQEGSSFSIYSNPKFKGKKLNFSCRKKSFNDLKKDFSKVDWEDFKKPKFMGPIKMDLGK